MGPLLLASFLSGVAALNYELLWMRKLTLVAGSTQAAISVVISVYFLGLALGNYGAGRIAKRLARPLRAYMILEFVIGVWAVVFGPLMAGMGHLYGEIYPSMEAGSVWVHGLRLLSAGVVMLVPTTCMGATLPLLAQFLAKDVVVASRGSAWLYGVNTLGAMVGTFATGFFLIERFGVSGPLMGTGVLNVACAVCVWRMAGLGRIDGKAETEQAVKGKEKISSLGMTLLVAFGVLGFCNIAAEVLWTRFYALIYRNDTYIFTTILLMYLLGIGVGSLIGAALAGRSKRGVYWLGMLQLVSAVWTIGMIYVSPAVAAGMGTGPLDFWVLLKSYFASVGVGTLPQTLCMGATFAILVRSAMGHHRQAGDVVGRALSWNTIGGVGGATSAGWLFLDRWGLEVGLYAVAGMTALVGVVLCCWTAVGRKRAWVPLGSLGLPTAAALILIPIDLPGSLIEMHFEPGAGMRLLETRPNIHGETAVTEEPSQDQSLETGLERRVWINSGWVARERGHTSLGYIPWILHGGEVDSALGICFGTGRTFGAMLNAGVRQMDLVDINGSVIALSRQWLSRSNFGIIDNPRANIVVDDGRNFVRYGQSEYDLITLEPLQMYQKGVVYFYTEDFYREARSRMREGAILCQWMPVYLVGEDDFRSMVRTFVEVFPTSMLWGRGPEMMLLGYQTDRKRIEYDEEEIYRRLALPYIRPELLREWIYQKYDLFIYANLDGRAMSAMSEGGQVFRDDHPRLEFTAPRVKVSSRANLELVREHLVGMRTWFDLPTLRVERLLERLRELQFDLFTGVKGEAEVEREMIAVHGRLYRDEGVGQGP